MRTKALLYGALIGAAGLVTSMAQVYSVNIVGYINIPIPGPDKFCLVANQLNNSGGNAVENLMPSPPNSITVYKFNMVNQGYDIANWDATYLYWDISLTLNPGDGFFILNGGPTYTQTFVGEVMTGNLSMPVQPGFNLVSSQVPQEGLLATDLKFPLSTENGDSIYKYNQTTSGYDIYNWDATYLYWDPEEPYINVGDGFFVLRGATASAPWTRTFNVGP